MTGIRLGAMFLLVLFPVFGIVGSEQSEDAMDARAVLRVATSLYRQADQFAASGESEAASEALRGAVLRYEQVGSSNGWSNGLLAYNAANAYLRLGDLGHAVLMYRRAEDLMPGNKNIRQGLLYARQQRIDEIKDPVSVDVARILIFWHYVLPTRIRASIFMTLWTIWWTGVLLNMLVIKGFNQRWLRPASVAFVLLGTALAVSLAAESIETSRPPGVIIADSLVARQGDGHSYEPSFSSGLHSGTEFLVLEDRGDWWHIRLADGRETWIVAGAGELI